MDRTTQNTGNINFGGLAVLACSIIQSKQLCKKGFCFLENWRLRRPLWFQCFSVWSASCKADLAWQVFAKSKLLACSALFLFAARCSIKSASMWPACTSVLLQTEKPSTFARPGENTQGMLFCGFDCICVFLICANIKMILSCHQSAVLFPAAFPQALPQSSRKKGCMEVTLWHDLLALHEWNLIPGARLRAYPSVPKMITVLLAWKCFICFQLLTSLEIISDSKAKLHGIIWEGTPRSDLGATWPGRASLCIAFSEWTEPLRVFWMFSVPVWEWETAKRSSLIGLVTDRCASCVSSLSYDPHTGTTWVQSMLDPAAEQCMQPAQPKRHCGDDAPLDLLQIFETKFDSRWTRLNCLDHPWSWASNLKVTKESSN